MCFKLDMECMPVASIWAPPEVFIYEPLQKRGDFFDFGGAAPILSPTATLMLQHHLESAGELLPLPYQDETFGVLNVLVCVDCLDLEATVHLNGGNRSWWKSYAFVPDIVERLPKSHLFKIPQRKNTAVLIWEDDPNVGFIADMKRNKIMGYKLTLLWEGHRGTTQLTLRRQTSTIESIRTESCASTDYKTTQNTINISCLQAQRLPTRCGWTALHGRKPGRRLKSFSTRRISCVAIFSTLIRPPLSSAHWRLRSSAIIFAMLASYCHSPMRVTGIAWSTRSTVSIVSIAKRPCGR